MAIKPPKAGDLITEGLLGRIVAQLERFDNLKSDSPYVRIESGPHGKLIELDLPVPTWALLSGSTSPYAWTEVYEGPSGTWPAMPSGDSGSVYEANGKSGLAGKVVPITWTEAGDWRFAWIGVGCDWTFTVRDLCTLAPIPGSLVSVSQSGVEIANCTTTGQVTAVTRVANGTNYTSPPTVTISGDGSGATATANMQLGTMTRVSGGSGYTNGTYTGLGTFTGGGGSGATFTFTVLGGSIQNSTPIVTRGSGYTSLPTPDFSAAGPGTGTSFTIKLNVLSLVLGSSGSGYTAATVGFSGGAGSGASGTATVATRCTLIVPIGDYDIEVTPPSGLGYATYTDTLTHTCGQATTITIDTDPDHACDSTCSDCTVIPASVDLTFDYDPGYTFAPWPDSTLTWDAANFGWFGDEFFLPGDAHRYHLVARCSGSTYVLAFFSPDFGDGNQLHPIGSGSLDTCVPFFAAGTLSADSVSTWTVMG